jgi:hypothetical protein
LSEFGVWSARSPGRNRTKQTFSNLTTRKCWDALEFAETHRIFPDLQTSYLNKTTAQDQVIEGIGRGLFAASHVGEQVSLLPTA